MEYKYNLYVYLNRSLLTFIICNQFGMKKITVTERIIKDMLFLLALPKQEVAPGISKRIEAEGRGETLQSIKVPCNIFFSFYRYDYEGRYHSHKINVCVRGISSRSNSEIPKGVYIALQSMRLDEKAWFNFETPDLHGVLGLPYEGCHYYIVVQDIKYKNSESFVSKKLVSEQYRKQAKQLYTNGQYEQAMKRYKKQINISEGVSKKIFTAQQIQQLDQINVRAKQNFLRCFNKLATFDETLSEVADNYSKELVKRKNDELSIFLRVHVLMQRKYLTNALELAKELQKRNSEEGKALIAQVEERMKKVK